MMKKALLAFAIVAFVACNSEGTKTETKDTTAAPAVAPVQDTTKKDTTVKAPVADTTKKADTTAKAKK